MSYAIYVGRAHTRDGHAWLAGYGDEPSSHWLEIIPAAQAVLAQFSGSALREGLRMVMALADGLEAELTAGGPLPMDPEPTGFDQIW